MEELTWDAQLSAEAALLLYMPISYGGLVVENTNRCTARCAMCYQSASPRGSETLGLGRLDADVVRRCIHEAASIETIAPRFHMAGGESFIYLDECLALFSEARDAGFQQISATTNGFWGRSLSRARAICGRLRSAGITSLEISWDHWHRAFVSDEAVSNCLIACTEAEIETTLRVLTTRQHGIDEALSGLRPEAVEAASRITSGPVFPTGRAAREIEPGEFYRASSLEGNCHRILMLTINSFGNVFPCCAGMDQTSTYVLGNVREESLTGIVERINNDPLIRRLVFSGIRSLVPLLEANGFVLGENFANMCHLCYTIFSTPEYSQVIQDDLNRRKRESLARLVAQLEQSIAGEGR